MTEKAIHEQLEAQKKATEKALKSDKAATDYLIKIGAIEPEKTVKKPQKKKNKWR